VFPSNLNEQKISKTNGIESVQSGSLGWGTAQSESLCFPRTSLSLGAETCSFLLLSLSSSYEFRTKNVPKLSFDSSWSMNGGGKCDLAVNSSASVAKLCWNSSLGGEVGIGVVTFFIPNQDIDSRRSGTVPQLLQTLNTTSMQSIGECSFKVTSIQTG
jgi:hypothetical protein